jgi:uncharacterized protein (TIGR00255 family)
MNPPRSMTGFARLRRATPQGEIVLTIKSVNHRTLDAHFRMPEEFDPCESALRAALKAHVARGHIEVRLSFKSARAEQASGLNRALLASYVSAFQVAAAEHGLVGAPDLNAALRVPGMLGTPEDEEISATVATELESAMGEALKMLNAFREREGAELVAAMRAANTRIASNADALEEIRRQAEPAFQSRLSERLAMLLSGAGIDPQRLAQEAAILVDRTDITEELARLNAHVRQMEQLFDAGGEIGKRADFLLQEMNRETNTILSKTSGVGELGLKITDLGLAVKADIEKIREQALNLE